eukprot:5468129-Pleurochrysis_carterae.AAC.1
MTLAFAATGAAAAAGAGAACLAFLSDSVNRARARFKLFFTPPSPLEIAATSLSPVVAVGAFSKTSEAVGSAAVS